MNDHLATINASDHLPGAPPPGKQKNRTPSSCQGEEKRIQKCVDLAVSELCGDQKIEFGGPGEVGLPYISENGSPGTQSSTVV